MGTQEYGEQCCRHYWLLERYTCHALLQDPTMTMPLTDGAERLQYPKLAWPGSAWWFTAIGPVCGVAVIIFPSLSVGAAPWRALAAATLLLSPIPIIMVRHWVALLVVLVGRANSYEDLVKSAVSLQSELSSAKQAIQAFLLERQGRHTYRIEFCYSFGRKAFIALSRKPGPPLRVGTQVCVVDQASYEVMGLFTVKDVDNGHYTCEQSGHVEALWLGYMHEHGNQHGEPPPGTLALALTASGDDANE